MAEGSLTHTDLDLRLTTSISYLMEGGVVTLLTISRYEWSSDYHSIVFTTNNPFDFSSENSGFRDMRLFSATRRLLAETKSTVFDPNVNFMLGMEEDTVGAILPSVTHGGSLELSYNINEP